MKLVIGTGIALNLNADDADVWLDSLGRGGDARNQATTSNRDNLYFKIGIGVQHLDADGALTCNDCSIIIGVDEAVILTSREFSCKLPGLVN